VAAVDRPNIVLTGFMGTGKSAVGQRLATLTGREYVDTDAEIIAKHGAIEHIFTRDGEEHFRALEREVVSDLAPRRNIVIATGGGTLLDEDNVLALLGAEIFTLKADPDEIVRRVMADGIEGRPLLSNSDDPSETIRALLAERAEAYERFSSVDTTGKSIDEVIDALRDAGASIISEEANGANGSATRSSTNLAVTLGVAAILAILIVLIVLVLTF
jgi:shikimate kinase